MENKPTPEQLAAQLRKPQGEMGLGVGEFMNEGNAFINELAYQSLQLEEWDNVLEIGPGNGAFVSKWIQPFEYVGYTGLDYSELMVEEAKKKNSQLIERGRVRFIEGDLSEMKFKSNSFNKIVTVNTLYFWPKPEENLLEIKRILAEEGKLIIAIRPEKNMKNLPVTEFGFTTYSKESVTKFLENGGFKIISVEEKLDPPMEFEGQTIQMESLVLMAEKA